MGWNYRVIHSKEKCRVSHEEEDTYAIHEVYYDRGGKVEFWTEEAVGIYADTIEGLREVAILYLSALTKPVLEYDQLPGVK